MFFVFLRVSYSYVFLVVLSFVVCESGGAQVAPLYYISSPEHDGCEVLLRFAACSAVASNWINFLTNAAHGHRAIVCVC
jgi:hypothetical protein